MINYRITILLGLSLVLMLALITGAGCQQEESTERALMVGNTTLHYDTSRVQQEMAAKLGRYLLSGWDLQKETLLWLDYSEGVWQFKFVPENDLLNDPDSIFVGSVVALEFSLLVFDGAKTEVHLCDDFFNHCEIVEALDYMAKFDTFVIYSPDQVDPAQVEELLAGLAIDYYNGETVTIDESIVYYLGYENSKWQLGRLFTEEALGDPYLEHTLSYFASVLSHEVFEGEEVEVFVNTDWLEEKKFLPGLPQMKSSYQDRNLFIYYNSDIIAETEVAKFSDFLIDAGLVTNELLFISLNRVENTWIMQIETPEVLINDPEYTSIVENLANDISTSHFNGEKLVIEICDEIFWPHVVVESAN